MNERRQELDERIADDERHSATMRKARDYDDLLARAEAAEARAVELINANNELARLNVDLQVQAGDLKAKLTSDEADENAWLDAYAESSARDGATIKRLLARAAELETALAAERDAHAWRPVTDDAPAPLEKVVVATRDDPDVAWRLPEVPHLWNTRRGRSLLTQEIAGYLPLPPQEPQ